VSSPASDWLETRVLISAPLGRDSLLTRRVLEREKIGSETCSDLIQLREQILSGAGAVVLTEEALEDGGLSELTETLRGQLPWSQLPFLLFPAVRAQSEVLSQRVSRLMESADVTLLDRPIRRVTLVSAVRAALRSRRRQYQVRDLLRDLESGVRDRDRFLAILGHELRNPLGAILLSIQLLDRQGETALPRERAVIFRQTRLLTRLVDDLLDVSRVTSGKIALHKRQVDLREIAERCVQSLSVAASAQRTELVLADGGSGAIVLGDVVRLEQILSNLLTNALKYTPPGGQIRVHVEPNDDMVELRVADTGVGIDAPMLSRIFDLFTQADSSLDRSKGGLGIGLTLVRSLVELHGGTVSASSAGRGEGSVFLVRLPRLAAPFPREAAKAEERVERLAPRRILVVEDNADLREGLKRLLEDAGHVVQSAENGEEGVARAISFWPDVALVDIGLPRLDGYAVARRIREELGDKVRLVALTGYGLPEDRVRARDAGFDGHLPKPVTLGAIEKALA
jgi:signal transduction histidine kinase